MTETKLLEKDFDEWFRRKYPIGLETENENLVKVAYLAGREAGKLEGVDAQKEKYKHILIAINIVIQNRKRRAGSYDLEHSYKNGAVEFYTKAIALLESE